MGRCVTIHLTEPARTHAAAAVYPEPAVADYEWRTQGELAAAIAECVAKRAAYIGPQFKDVPPRSCVVREGCVFLTLEDGGVYVYPLHSVARVKQFDEVLALPAPDPVDDDWPF